MWLICNANLEITASLITITGLSHFCCAPHLMARAVVSWAILPALLLWQIEGKLMSNWKLLSGVAAASIMTAAIIAPAEAQVTTSNIRGEVVDASGAAVAGVTVTVVDNRTGSADTATTNANGVYSVRSLRVGGPYTITVETADGSASRENVFLQVNETFAGDLQLIDARTLETVVVTGSAGDGVLAQGPRSSFNLETIEGLPSISRDIRDIARLDPLVTVDPTNGGAISIAGTNNRFNSLTIDGIKFNDLLK